MTSTQGPGARAEPRSSDLTRRGGRRTGRPLPCRALELAHLSLDELRDYRQELAAEESRTTYWRRIAQARLDLVIHPDDHRALQRLRAVLAQHARSSRRLASLPVTAPGESPELPDLAVLWETAAHGCAPDLAARLAAAEQQLSAYSGSLHRRMDAATGELIARYHDQPVLALRALPQVRRSA